MDYVTKGLEPAAALRYFEELSSIPRGSRKEAAVAQYCLLYTSKKRYTYFHN